MGEKDERPFWTPELQNELIETLERHSIDVDDLQEVYLIISCLMNAILRSAVIRGVPPTDLDKQMDQFAAGMKKAARDPNFPPWGNMIEL
jgi:hypothetical protein